MKMKKVNIPQRSGNLGLIASKLEKDAADLKAAMENLTSSNNPLNTNNTNIISGSSSKTDNYYFTQIPLQTRVRQQPNNNFDDSFDISQKDILMKNSPNDDNNSNEKVNLLLSDQNLINEKITKLEETVAGTSEQLDSIINILNSQKPTKRTMNVQSRDIDLKLEEEEENSENVKNDEMQMTNVSEMKVKPNFNSIPIEFMLLIFLVILEVIHYAKVVSKD